MAICALDELNSHRWRLRIISYNSNSTLLRVKCKCLQKQNENNLTIISFNQSIITTSSVHLRGISCPSHQYLRSAVTRRSHSIIATFVDGDISDGCKVSFNNTRKCVFLCQNHDNVLILFGRIICEYMNACVFYE